MRGYRKQNIGWNCKEMMIAITQKQRREKVIDKRSGITLVALVISIIIILVLAAITINMTIGENGIIQRAMQAKENTFLAQIEEEESLNRLYNELFENGGPWEEASKEELAEISEFKKAIAEAITRQKVETSSEDSIDTMVENIAKILKARTEDATATSEDIGIDKTAYVNGEKLVGSTSDKVIEEQEEQAAVPLKEKFYLYHEGNQYTDITGGWRLGYNPGYSSLTFRDTYMEYYTANSNYDCNLNTAKAIDLSGYSRLYFEFEFPSSTPQNHAATTFGVGTNPRLPI